MVTWAVAQTLNDLLSIFNSSNPNITKHTRVRSQKGKIKLDQGEEERPIIKASQYHHHKI